MTSGSPAVRGMRNAALILVAWAIQSTTGIAAETGQQVICEVSHVNAAWGFQHSGIYIDPTGSVGEFRYAAEDSRSVPNRGQPMTQVDLRNKYQPGRRAIGQVCPARMIWLREQLNDVRYAPASKPTHASFDAGMQFTQCWLFESESKPGQHVLLRETGDFESRNLAEAAPALANWIEAVARDARDKAHIPAHSKGCIDYPESMHQQYDQTVHQSDQDREQAMKALTTAGGLRCQMGKGQWFGVSGTNIEQRPTPENFELNYFQLDLESGAGRAFGVGDETHAVHARVTPIGIVLEDHPMDGQELRTTTVVPYRIGGQNRFPAVMNEALFDSSGLVATTYVGSCIAIPRT